MNGHWFSAAAAVRGGKNNHENLAPKRVHATQTMKPLAIQKLDSVVTGHNHIPFMLPKSIP